MSSIALSSATKLINLKKASHTNCRARWETPLISGSVTGETEGRKEEQDVEFRSGGGNLCCDDLG